MINEPARNSLWLPKRKSSVKLMLQQDSLPFLYPRCAITAHSMPYNCGTFSD